MQIVDAISRRNKNLSENSIPEGNLFFTFLF